MTRAILDGQWQRRSWIFPRLVGRRRLLPVFSVLDEHSCLKDDLEYVGYDLEWGVGIVARIRIFDGILDLLE